MADLKQVIQLFLSEAEDFKKKIQDDDDDEDQEYMLEIIEETIDELSEISRRCLLEETDAANMFAASKLANGYHKFAYISFFVKYYCIQIRYRV